MEVLSPAESNLSGIIRDFKIYTAKGIFEEMNGLTESRCEWLIIIFKYHAKFNKRSKELQFWNHENHTIALTRNEMIDSKVDYIHQNPYRSAIAENIYDYLYSSARNIAGLESLIETDEL